MSPPDDVATSEPNKSTLALMPESAEIRGRRTFDGCGWLGSQGAENLQY